MAGAVVRNWARSAACRPQRTLRPGSEAELAAGVRQAAADGLRVRVVGAHHSWTPVACSDDALVSLDGLDRVLRVEGTRVTVEAGIRLYALNEALAERGLALPCVGSIDQQSVAGAISTGTHGSGHRQGVLSTQVAALRLLTASGEILDLSPQSRPALFDAARLGLGCLGVITAVTLQCVPAFRLAERATPLRFDDAVARLPGLLTASTFAKLWWLPHTDRVQLYAAEVTEEPPTSRPVGDWLDRRLLNPVVFPGILGLSSRIPALIPAMNGVVSLAYFQPRARVERSDRILHVPMPPRHQETEYALPLEAAPEAMRGLKALIERDRLRVNFVAELRVVAGDGLPLSPAQGRASCYLGGYTANCPDATRYMAAVEQLALSLGGRPHWGKHFSLDHARLRSIFPGMDGFLALRREADPAGLFLNPFVAEKLGIEG